MEPFYFFTFACVYIEVLISCMAGWSDRPWSFEQKEKKRNPSICETRFWSSLSADLGFFERKVSYDFMLLAHH